MNFFAPSLNSLDNCWLFIMQLACILHMVPSWKRAFVRVLMCVDSKTKDAGLIKQKWQNMLLMLRIEAQIEVVNWDHVTSTLLEQSNSNSFSDSGVASEDANEAKSVTEVYLKSVNSLIQEQSTNTAVTFLYLPAPSNKKSARKLYLRRLDVMTSDLPPTLLVHGISPVTSTTL